MILKYVIALCALLFAAVSPATAGETPLSPAEQRIAWARSAIETHPKNWQAYNELALGLARRARETASAIYYDQAEAALEKSFRLAPDNMEGRKTRVWVLLGKHEFARALEEARKLNREAPDDLMVYGFLADANAELGNYPEAEEAAQWMLDLRPGNIPGLTRAAYLRELFGDIDGAGELLNTAYHRTAPTEVEDLAWIVTQLAHLSIATGNPNQGEKLLDQALALFPNYHYALANMATVKTAQEKYDEAIDLSRKVVSVSPSPNTFAALGDLYRKTGHPEEARKQYDMVEYIGRICDAVKVSCDRELALFYADHDLKPQEALRLARRELEARKDIHAYDLLAWVLLKNGSPGEAATAIAEAMKLGTRDASIFFHAGMIYQQLGDSAMASKFLNQALATNPRFHLFHADTARRLLLLIGDRTSKNTAHD